MTDSLEAASKLTRTEVEAYLHRTNRSAGSLVAGYWLTKDPALLKEAATRFPDDPQVQLAVLTADVFPEQRWRWIEAFKRTAPDNALANYLAAAEYFKAGQTDQAIAELTASASKSGLSLYRRELTDAFIAAYLAAGFAQADAAILGFATTPLPTLSGLRDTARQAIGVANELRTSGDRFAADALDSQVLHLGEQLIASDDGKILITELVGIAMQKMALQDLAPADTTSSRLADLEARIAAIKAATQTPALEQTLALMSDAEIIEYFRRVETDGEYEALLWLQNQQVGR